MSKKSRLRRLFDKQHGKSAQALLKSTSQYLYHIHWSLPIQLSWEKSLLLTCKTMGLLVNTMPANEKYPVLNRDTLTIPIQMQLSQKQENFSHFFFLLFKLYIKFWIFWEKRWPSELLYFRYYGLQKCGEINV